MTQPRIIDGGLATQLEASGCLLHPQLWSASLVLDDPQAVERAHRAFVEAGAEILITASYQMSYGGLASIGLDRAAADDALRETVRLARRAASHARIPALVAASIGPYGASRADGSEYTGDYDLDSQALEEFHRERLAILAAAKPDLLAIETIPSMDEACALRRLLDTTDGPPAWVSFSCRDEKHLNDGTRAEEAARLLEGCARVTAVGVNCTAPEYVEALIESLASASSKRILVYPNSGEGWQAEARSWTGSRSPTPFVEMARRWAARGVWAIGGCCRVGPETIRELTAALGR